MTTQTVRFVKKATEVGGWYWYSKAAQLHLRQHLRDCALGRFKQADIGGDQESSFEQAFSSLAYSYVKDKSPRLIDYIVGFQLVDRNEDNTKAMGVFGFKVGDQWLYAPVFFLNGDLKGHELLYMKKQDAFVPMKENWVNYLISRKPHVLGEGSPKDTYQLGGIPPDLYRLTHPPTSSKYGADAYVYRPELQEWARPFLGFLGAAATKAEALFEKQAGLAEKLDLRNFLGESFELLKAAWELCEQYPLLKNGFDRFYGPNFFYEMGLKVKAAQDSLLNPSAPRVKKPNEVRPRSEVARQKAGGFSLIPPAPRPQHPCKTGELRIFVHDDFAVPPAPPRFRSLLDRDTVERVRGKSAADEGGKNKVDADALGAVEHNRPELTDAERSKLLHDTVLIKDKRDPHAVSMVYNTQVEMALVNPTTSGIYEVLEKPGTFDRMLVVMHPQTNKGREEFCTLVRLSDPRNWLNVHPTKVYVKAGTEEPSKDDFEKWFKKVDNASPAKDGHYLAVGANGAGTTPFRVRQAYEDGVWTVDFKDYASWNMGSSPFSPKRRYSSLDDADGYVSTYDAKVFVNKFPGSKLRSVQGELSIPKGFKLLKLKDPPPPPKPDRKGSLIGCCSEIGSDSDGSAEKPIQPGNLADVQLLINEKTASVKLHDTGANEVWITSHNGHERMSKKAALICLVRDHGVGADAAREMLKAAEAMGRVNRAVTYRVKYADWVKEAEPMSNNALQPGPGAPGFPMPLTGMERVGPSAYPAMYPQEESHQVPELLSSQTDPTIYDPFYQPDQRAMQMAQEAGASGQKEVFDTAMISGMLKAVRQDSLVDRYLGDLMKALDKVGRILFMFYWHQEEFEDRYGKQDLPELEDTARNAFEVLGDLTLFLKEKQVGDSISGVGGQAGQSSEPNLQESARN